MDPVHDPEPISTSLSNLSDHEWQILSSRWARGMSWVCVKVGRKWSTMNDGLGFPLFNTKREAYDRTNALICTEARHRAWVRRQQERAVARRKAEAI